MSFTESDLKHLESLARVRLSGESREKLKRQLADIIDFVQCLQAVDTTGQRPRLSGGDFRPRLRDDVTEPCLPHDEVLSRAPEREGPLFKVPTVIETEEP